MTDDDRASNGDAPEATGLVLTERRTDEGLLVAICDDDVLGESFEEGEISLTVTEEFYGGDLVDDDAALASLRRAAVANLVGERTVGLAIEAGIVEEANVLDVDGTRHAQVLSLR
jgi:hypothetical protein